MKKYTVGFTLIELLVSISIIAMILAVAMPNLLNARQRARDAQKKEYLAQIKTALRLYYNDFHSYPADTGGPTYFLINGCGTTGASSCLPGCTYGDFIAGGSVGLGNCNSEATIYMKKLPFNTAGTQLALSGAPIYYYKLSSGDDFLLKVILENTNDPDLVSTRARCPGKTENGVTKTCGTSDYCVCAD